MKSVCLPDADRQDRSGREEARTPRVAKARQPRRLSTALMGRLKGCLERTPMIR